MLYAQILSAHTDVPAKLDTLGRDLVALVSCLLCRIIYKSNDLKRSKKHFDFVLLMRLEDAESIRPSRQNVSF